MTTRPLPEAAARALLSLIFLVSGTTHLARPEAVLARVGEAPFAPLASRVAPAEALVLAAGVALLAGGLAFLVGYRTRLAALGLIAVLVPITLTVQLGPDTLGPLFKNVAILGGLVFFAAHGTGAYSVDRLIRERRARALRPALS